MSLRSSQWASDKPGGVALGRSWPRIRTGGARRSRCCDRKSTWLVGSVEEWLEGDDESMEEEAVWRFCGENEELEEGGEEESDLSSWLVGDFNFS